MAMKVDGRRARGDITRRKAATCAAEIGTVIGLGSISVTQLAEGTGLSKSGILTVFKSREAIQLAAVEVAREIFVQEIVTPAWDKKPGTTRLKAYVDNWFDHVERGVFPGGCFLANTVVEFGSQQGPVADAIKEFQATWVQLLEGELAVGQSDTKKSRDAVVATAFKLNAFMNHGNARYRLTGDKEHLSVAKHCCREELRTLTA